MDTADSSRRLLPPLLLLTTGEGAGGVGGGGRGRRGRRRPRRRACLRRTAADAVNAVCTRHTLRPQCVGGHHSTTDRHTTTDRHQPPTQRLVYCYDRAHRPRRSSGRFRGGGGKRTRRAPPLFLSNFRFFNVKFSAVKSKIARPPFCKFLDPPLRRGPVYRDESCGIGPVVEEV